MKKNKIRAVLATMAAVFFVTIGSSVTAYANVPDDADDGGSVEVIFSDTEDTEEVSENDIPEDIEEDESGDAEGILTPEGNLTLVDDIDEEHSDSLQYMTVQTRNGNYFYLIVDRSGSSDNVYFLNMVDESDLLQILSEEDQELIDQINHKDEEEEKPILIDDTETDEPEEEIQDTGSRLKSSIPTLLIFLVIGGVVAGAYYFFKIKPNKNQPQYDEDMEFYDDEDYINEDEEYLDEEDTEAGEDADDPKEDPEDVLDDDFQFLNFDDAGVDPDL